MVHEPTQYSMDEHVVSTESKDPIGYQTNNENLSVDSLESPPPWEESNTTIHSTRTWQPTHKLFDQDKNCMILLRKSVGNIPACLKA